jgi:uncharacterized membrane protein YidH (DUF202 family)
VNEPLEDQKPDGDERAMRRQQGRRAARQAIVTGAALLVCSAGLMGLAFWIGQATVNKYLVALAFILLCLGIGLVINGTWDWRRARARSH